MIMVTDAMKEKPIKLQLGNRWLVWDEFAHQWAMCADTGVMSRYDDFETALKDLIFVSG